MSDVGIVEEERGKLGMKLMMEYLKGCLRREEKGMGEGRKESAVSLRLHRVQDQTLAFFSYFRRFTCCLLALGSFAPRLALALRFSGSVPANGMQISA